MKITAVESLLFSYPLTQGFTSASAKVDHVACLLVTVKTDTGLEGVGYAYLLGGTPITPVKVLVDFLAGIVIGMDAIYTMQVWEAMWRACSFIGARGLPCFAIAAIDTALWDIKGKAAGLPVYQLLGAYSQKIPAYYSGLFLSASVDDLIAEAKQKVDDGWWALKMRLGAKMTLAENRERVQAVREAVGDKVVLLADASRQLSVPTAIQLGRLLQDYNFAWFEDPIDPNEIHAHAAVAAALEIPVATGEMAYSRYDFQNLLESRAADIWMPDLERVGGITEWMRVGAMAHAANIPMASHVFQEISVHVLASLPNTLFLEYLPLWDDLFNEKLQFENGYALVPQGAGLGLTVNWDFVDKWRV